MTGKSKEVDASISLEELRRPSLPEMDLNQPVEAAPPRPNIDAARSTTDPLQINFAAADIADKLHHSHVGSGMKVFALVFVGGPTIIAGIAFIVTAWSDHHAEPISVLIGTVLGLAVAGFWPYVIFANRRKKRRRS